MNMTPCSRPRVHIALPLYMRQHNISSVWILLEEQALKESRAQGADPDACRQKAAAAFEQYICCRKENAFP